MTDHNPPTRRQYSSDYIAEMERKTAETLAQLSAIERRKADELAQAQADYDADVATIDSEYAVAKRAAETASAAALRKYEISCGADDYSTLQEWRKEMTPSAAARDREEKLCIKHTEQEAKRLATAAYKIELRKVKDTFTTRCYAIRSGQTTREMYNKIA